MPGAAMVRQSTRSQRSLGAVASAKTGEGVNEAFQQPRRRPGSALTRS